MSRQRRTWRVVILTVAAVAVVWASTSDSVIGTGALYTMSVATLFGIPLMFAAPHDEPM